MPEHAGQSKHLLGSRTFHADTIGGRLHGRSEEHGCGRGETQLSSEERSLTQQPVGIQHPLTKLPGNNPEFNSSRISNNPRRPDSAYIESGRLVPVTPANGGVCKDQKCTDYSGPRDVSASPSAMPSSSAAATASISVESSAIRPPNTTRPRPSSCPKKTKRRQPAGR
jgi:hypothetical protein